MLIHVFNDVMANFPDSSLAFLKQAAKFSEVGRVWKDGDALVLEGTPIKTGGISTYTWTSGQIYKKLCMTKSVSPRFSLPVIWNLCRYYDTIRDETCTNVREYLLKKYSIETELAPFYLLRSRLYTKYKTKQKDLKIKSPTIKYVVDKGITSVILLPHKGIVKSLLSLLKDTSL